MATILQCIDEADSEPGLDSEALMWSSEEEDAEDEQLSAQQLAKLPQFLAFIQSTLELCKAVLRSLLVLKVVRGPSDTTDVAKITLASSLEPVLKHVVDISSSVDEFVIAATLAPHDDAALVIHATAIADCGNDVVKVMHEALTTAGAAALIGKAGVQGAEKCSAATTALTVALTEMARASRTVKLVVQSKPSDAEQREPEPEPE
jgi:hypothetical protein